MTNILINLMIMATVTLGGNKVEVKGNFPKIGSEAPAFTLVGSDLKDFSLNETKGKRVVLNIFPSLDTKVCAMSVRKFNEMAAQMNNTVVLAISKDLPFAHARFCSTEGIDKVIPISAFRNNSFGEDYGVAMSDGALAGLFARAVIVLDEKGKVIYEELVPEITHEPNYEAALKALK